MDRQLLVSIPCVLEQVSQLRLCLFPCKHVSASAVKTLLLLSVLGIHQGFTLELLLWLNLIIYKILLARKCMDVKQLLSSSLTDWQSKRQIGGWWVTVCHTNYNVLVASFTFLFQLGILLHLPCIWDCGRSSKVGTARHRQWQTVGRAVI